MKGTLLSDCGLANSFMYRVGFGKIFEIYLQGYIYICKIHVFWGREINSNFTLKFTGKNIDSRGSCSVFVSYKKVGKYLLVLSYISVVFG